MDARQILKIGFWITFLQVCDKNGIRLNMKRILFYGETGKCSAHGVSISNAIFLSDISKLCLIDVVEERVTLESYGFVGISKVIRYILAVLISAKKSFLGSYDYFYTVYSLSPLGCLKTFFIVMVVKLCSPKTKIIIHIHRGDLRHKLNQYPLILIVSRILWSYSSKIILISRKEVHKFNDQAFLGYKKYAYVPNSIELEGEFATKCRSNDTYLYLSNYILEKGIIDLLEIWRSMPSNRILECFGSETPNVTRNLLQQNYLRDNVTISSAISGIDKMQRIAQAKALILPSWNEGLPLVILEAMSVGTPVIASDVGYIREMLGSDYPFLFEARNLEMLKRVVDRFESWPKAQRMQLGEQLQKKYKSEYGRHNRADAFMQIFES